MFSPCITPDTVYSFSIHYWESQALIKLGVALPHRARRELTETEAHELQDKLHDAIARVIADTFYSAPPAEGERS